MRRLTAILICLLSESIVSACNVPVFRYALERWRPDFCEVIVFHDGNFTAEQKQFLQSLDITSLDGDGTANLKVIRQHVSEPMDDATNELWSTLQKSQPAASVPQLVVRSRVGRGRLVNNWHGSLDDAVRSGIVQSPVRRELSRRLVTGDSAVWLVLKSDDAERNKATISILSSQLKALGSKIPLPEGIGLPGSELFSDVPLLMRFSVLEIDPKDPEEAYLVRLFHGLDPDSTAAGDPLVVPVFGRGRALEVIPASKVDAGLVEDLTLFLCGACSCQVKDLNPGFDLLLSAAWNKELFGENLDDVTARLEAGTEDVALPELVLIPPGQSTTGNLSSLADKGEKLEMQTSEKSIYDAAVTHSAATVHDHRSSFSSPVVVAENNTSPANSVFSVIAVLVLFVGFIVLAKASRATF